MDLKRNIEQNLKLWKESSSRKPLLIRGARQVGKSFIIRKFGEQYFENIIELNLEEKKNLRKIFSSNNPELICENIALELNQAITPGSSLLFIDEIQESSEALLALRYFYEKLPELHIIAAGSLLDFVLDKEKEVRIPVGRIEYQYMFPMSFTEFLSALNENIANDVITNISLKKIPLVIAHEKLLSLFNRYILCGGMPAVVKEYITNSSNLKFIKIQADMLQAYQDDFRKYKTRIDQEKIETIFFNIARHISKNFKLNTLSKDFSQASTKQILSLLCKARILNSVKASAGNGLPLGAEVNEKKNKYLFMDVGLLNSILGLTEGEISRWNFDLTNAGSIAEQVVGQELLAYSNSNFKPELYYWTRDKKGSSAEVDYLYSTKQKIFPLEVKSGVTGKLKSMRMFVENKNVPFGIRISQHELSFHDKVLSIPFYAISNLDKLCVEALNS